MFAQQSATTEHVRNAALGYFTLEQVLDAKNALWVKCGTETIGEKQRRKDSTTRPEKEAHLQDILNALSKPDRANKLPVIGLYAHDLHTIPRSHPEELNDICLVDRLNRLEKRLTSLQEVVDRTVSENIWIKEKLDQNHSQSYAQVVARSTPAQDRQFSPASQTGIPRTGDSGNRPLEGDNETVTVQSINTVVQEEQRSEVLQSLTGISSSTEFIQIQRLQICDSILNRSAQCAISTRYQTQQRGTNHSSSQFPHRITNDCLMIQRAAIIMSVPNMNGARTIKSFTFESTFLLTLCIMACLSVTSYNCQGCGPGKVEYMR